jgi:transposase InsO family protein
VFSQAYQLARTRLASAGSPVLRLVVERDHAVTELELLRREIVILRASRAHMPPQRRPEYPPEQRLAILQLRQLRGWNIAETAERFVLHTNTIRSWIKAVQGTGNMQLLQNAMPWNRISDALRWTTQEIRRLCPEPEFGTRTIARHLVRAGIAVSRSTVQRVLREKPACSPRPQKPPMEKPADCEPDHLLKPLKCNDVWHMDLTHVRILWFSFTLAAILDGFSRKLLAFKVCARTPHTRDMTRLVNMTAKACGSPRFVITDHGTQFGKQFKKNLADQGITQIRGRVRAPFLNGKMERAFRTFRIWWRLVLVVMARRNIQKRLDAYRHWYNEHRPYSVHGALTPQEVWKGKTLSEPVAYRSREDRPCTFDVHRLRCRDDPRLPIIRITRRAA